MCWPKRAQARRAKVENALKIGLPADVEGRVRENAVDGELLCSLGRADLVNEVELTPLQAAKVLIKLK